MQIYFGFVRFLAKNFISRNNEEKGDSFKNHRISDDLLHIDL
jgi:hypothetical protein